MQLKARHAIGHALSKLARIDLADTALRHLLNPKYNEQRCPAVMVFHGMATWNIFCIGMLFGNFNALAMEPLGHMAGLGAALTGSVSTLISLPLGWLIGHLYDGNVLPLVGGFALMGSMSLMLMRWTEQGQGLDE